MKQIGYVYSGAIPELAMNWIRSAINDGYVFLVETKPDVHIEDPDKLLKTRTWIHESQDGATWPRSGARYWVCSKNPYDNNSNRFFGFMDEEDRQTFIRACADKIVNPEPFKTVM